jgi:hypothetical protein
MFTYARTLLVCDRFERGGRLFTGRRLQISPSGKIYHLLFQIQIQFSHLTCRMVAPKGRYVRRQWTSSTSLVPSILSSFLLLVLG